MNDVKLTEAQLDRAGGVLLAQACGDALGVPYEFKPPMPRDERAEMKGSAVLPTRRVERRHGDGAVHR